MERNYFKKLNFEEIPSPCFVVDEVALADNLKIIDYVQQNSGARVLLALKGFAMFSVFPLLRQVLHGACASSLFEARLGREEFGKEVHIYSPAYPEPDFPEILKIADHIIFNSLSQWEKYRPVVEKSDRLVHCGLRLNPEHSEVEVPLYDPCAVYSRLGITARALNGQPPEGIDGLHFHALCESNSDSLERTLAVFEKNFGACFPQMKWFNFGGGHHITRADYNVELLCKLIRDFKSRYDAEVYLEPGEAIGLNTGVLVTTVLDVIHNGMDIAILDTSATDHMPDVLEMPYRPQIIGAAEPGQAKYTYRLGGMSCLAGDVIGDYAFPQPLKPGSKLVFLDMAHYSMVKTTMFNGLNLPSIGIWNSEKNEFRLVKSFGYEDYKGRLS